MDFSTLEIIGLAFMSGLKVAEITKELEDEDEKAKKIIDYIQNNLTNKDKEEK